MTARASQTWQSVQMGTGTGSNDGAVKLWPLLVDDLIASACRSSGRNLTAVEWQMFFGSSPYRKTCLDVHGQ